ncbi:MAG: WD40 repeat domain-containing protein [Ignavibacteriales bacterium]|nr:WD40 repeat domain-containing protein [Ignavibacteriales bacterium]
MDKSEKNKSELAKFAKNNKLTPIRNDILSSVDSKKLRHEINFNLLKQVNELLSANALVELFATFGDGSEIMGYDAVSGKVIHSQKFDANTKEIFCGFKPSSGWVISIDRKTGDSGKLLAFDTTLSKSLNVHTKSEKINNLLLTPDKFIITSSLEGNAEVYRASDWKFVRCLSDKKLTPITSLGLVPFSKFILLGYVDGSVKMYDYQKGTLIKTKKLTNQSIKSLSASHEIVAALTTDNQVLVFDYDFNIIWEHKSVKGNVIKIGLGDITSHSPRLLTEKHKSDHFLTSLIFVGLKSGAIMRINLKDKTCSSFEQHCDEVTSLLISPANYLISGSKDGSIRRIFIPTMKCEKIYHQNDGCRSIAISPNKKYFCASGVADNTAKLLDFCSGKIVNIFKHQHSIRTVEFASLQGRDFIFTGGWDAKVYQWNMNDYSLFKEFSIPDHPEACVCDLKINTNNNLLAIAYYIRESFGGYVLFDLKTNKMLTNCIAHDYKDVAQSVFLQLSDDWLYSAGDDGKIHKWALSDYKLDKSFSHGSAIKCIFLSQNNQVFSGALDGTIKIFDIPSGKEKSLYGNGGCIYHVILTGDNKFLFSATASGRINKFDLRSGTLVHTFCFHSALIWQLIILDNTLISAAVDGRVNFISIETGHLLGSYYNTKNSFLWSTPENDDGDSYYWTNNFEELIKVYETPGDREVYGTETKSYHAIHNNQNIVMSRINDSSYYKIFKASAAKLQQQKLIDGILSSTECNNLLS